MDLIKQNAKALVAAVAVAASAWVAENTGEWWTSLAVVVLGAVATWAVPNAEA